MALINPGSKVSNNVEVKVADITAIVNGTDDGSAATQAATDLDINVNLINDIINKAS